MINDNWKSLLQYLATGTMPGETRCFCEACLDGDEGVHLDKKH